MKKTYKQTGREAALKTAYEAVLQIGFSPKKLMEEFHEVNYPTLRRIRDGDEVKDTTYGRYMQLFLRLLRKEYEKCIIENGGVGASYVLRYFSEILCAEYEIPIWPKPLPW